MQKSCQKEAPLAAVSEDEQQSLNRFSEEDTRQMLGVGSDQHFTANDLRKETVRLTDKSMFISGIKPVTDGLGEIIIQQFIEPRLNAKIWVCFATLELNTHSDRTVLPLPTFTAIVFASLGAWCTLRKAIPNSSSFARTLWHCWHCCSSKAITAL